jgi:protein phosphatase
LWLLVLVLAVVAVYATYAWTQTQYFVGSDGDQVAVFRGVDTQFGPLKFFGAQEHTDLLLDSLTPVARAQVRDGITASDRKDADQIVARLRQQQLPVCEPTPPASATSSTPSQTVSSESATPTVTPTAKTPAKSPTGKLGKGAKVPTPSTTPEPTISASPTESPTTPPPAPPSQVPGVTCRTS